MTTPSARDCPLPIVSCSAKPVRYPKNAAMSMMPSMPMFTTPDRSQITPQRAPSASGEKGDDEGLEDSDDPDGDARLDLHERRPGTKRPEEARREEDADRIGSTEESDRDRVESDRRGDAGCVEADDAEHLDRAGHAAEQARKAHREGRHEGRAHAGVARRVRVLPDGADLEADRRSFENPAHGERGRHRDGDPEVKISAKQDRERAVADVTGPRERESGRTYEIVHRPREQEDGRVVQHDRGHDLVRSRPRLEEAGDESERGPTDRAGEHRQSRADPRGRTR